MGDNVKLVPALCTQCGGTVEVDSGSEKALCPFCGASFIVEKAVNNYNVQHATIEHADNVNIDMSGSVKTVLDFVGEQMKESREFRKEARKEAAEREKTMNANFFKIFGIMFAVMMAVCLIVFIVLQFTDSDDGVSTWQTDYTYSEDNVISCYITDDGLLSVNITDPGSYEWRYDEDDSTGILSASDADFDGYHFTVEPSQENGTGYAVVAEYDQDAPEDAMPYSYGIVKYDIASEKISRISKISHKDDFP